jgi:hypothetical protein
VKDTAAEAGAVVRSVVAGALEVLHEGTIDLDETDAELAQIAE